VKISPTGTLPPNEPEKLVVLLIFIGAIVVTAPVPSVVALPNGDTVRISSVPILDALCVCSFTHVKSSFPCHAANSAFGYMKTKILSAGS